MSAARKNLNDKDLLFAKQIATEVGKHLPLQVAKEIEKTVNVKIENMRMSFSKKLAEETLRLDTSIRELKNGSRSNGRKKNDFIKQISIIVIGALLIGIMPSLFEFIAKALMK